jgi:hypothetical protein
VSEAPSLPRLGMTAPELAENRARLAACPAHFHTFLPAPPLVEGSAARAVCHSCQGAVHPVSASWYEKGMLAARRVAKGEVMARLHSAMDKLVG